MRTQLPLLQSGIDASNDKDADSDNAVFPMVVAICQDCNMMLHKALWVFSSCAITCEVEGQLRRRYHTANLSVVVATNAKHKDTTG